MKYIARQASLVVASLVTIMGLAVVPVSAQHGADASTDSNLASPVDDDSSTTSSGSNSGRQVHVADSTTITEGSDDNSGAGSGKLRAAAQQLLQTERQKVKEHTEAQRQKACEQRQKSIDARASNYAAAAQRHLDVFNSIFTKVQAFQTNKQLNVANYNSLVSAATSQQTAAQSAVDDLKALNVTIDCTQADPATTVATLKTAVENARTSLQSYRSSIKDVVVALKGASTAQKTAEGSDQ